MSNESEPKTCLSLITHHSLLITSSRHLSPVTCHSTKMVTRTAFLYLARHEGLKDLRRASALSKDDAALCGGRNNPEAVAGFGRGHKLGASASFDHLNESSPPRERNRKCANISGTRAIDDTGIASNVSIKLTQFGLEIDPSWPTRTPSLFAEAAGVGFLRGTWNSRASLRYDYIRTLLRSSLT